MTGLWSQSSPQDDWFRRRIEFALDPADLDSRQLGVEAARLSRATLPFAWPEGAAPQAAPFDDEPATSDPLPRAYALVIAWTVAEARALADVLTPGVSSSRRWYRYDRGFESYLPFIRSGAPARLARRLGSYHPTTIGTRTVVCFKSELHLNQDGVRIDGQTSLPVATLIQQLIDEVQPKVLITTGTCGATFRQHGLGDVIVTRGAMFRLGQEFADAPFASTSYRSRFRVRSEHLPTAEGFMAQLAGNLEEPAFGVPADGYDVPGLGDGVVAGPAHTPVIRVDGQGGIPAGHPILSADWFLFGSTTNGVDADGVGVEMGDAVVAMVCERRRAQGRPSPSWVVVRNFSNPAINGNLPRQPVDMQAHWSGWYYETFGYWTSVNSALACWALLAP